MKELWPEGKDNLLEYKYWDDITNKQVKEKHLDWLAVTKTAFTSLSQVCLNQRLYTHQHQYKLAVETDQYNSKWTN